ncbi:GMC oxidoreductase, partial [Rugosimonospora africana]|uniref:GMC oxidoreductase n=1 Tax=Rugosimonospora africana TaxID=556532 RepID=UPI003570EBAA
MRTALRVAREVGQAGALADWRSSEILSGVDTDEVGCASIWVARRVPTSTGTCQMGTDDMSVVDPELRVQGFELVRLRCVLACVLVFWPV